MKGMTPHHMTLNTIKNGKKHGYWTELVLGVQSKGYYNQGEKTGLWKYKTNSLYYFDNNVYFDRYLSGKYVNNKKVGVWNRYREDGFLLDRFYIII